MMTLTGEPSSNLTADAAPATVRRQAFYLSSRGQPVFAWLDMPDPAPAFARAVLVCPPLGYEQVHSHRALRHLADELARAGFLVCRIDYPGTGDSPGADADPDRLAAWEASIRDAATWLKSEFGCGELHLVGLRLGALLAMRVAVELDVDSLILWAPLLKGRQYVREMQALEMTAQPQGSPAQSSGDIEAAGFTLSEQTAADLSALDALSLRPKTRRALIVARDDRADNRKLLDHLSAQRIDTRQICVPGFDEMMAEPHETAVPRTAIDGIAQFLRESVADTPHASGQERCRQSPPQFPISMVAGEYRESIAMIAGPPDLFAIVTAPTRETDINRPLIVLLNAGAAYHIGPNRLHVLMARNLAASGFRSVRIDSGKFGDSFVPADDLAIDTYTSSVFRDVDRILTHARVQWNARRVVLVGLCSGAYFAFQAAAQFSNPALVESVMLNPLAYFWAEGMTVQSSDKLAIAEFESHMRSALQPAMIWKLLTGRTKTGLRGAFQALYRRLRTRGPIAMPDSTPHSVANDCEVSHPPRESLVGDLEGAIAKGRRLAFVFSEGDPGLSLLKHFGGHAIEKLCRDGAAEISVIPNADHTFSRWDPRRRLFDSLTRHLLHLYGEVR